MDADTKACEVCGETIKAVALKCRFCNTDLQAFAAARELRIEREIFSGHPAIIYSVYQITPFLLALGLTIAIAYQANSGTSIVYAILGFFVVCVLISLWFCIKSWRKRYLITTQRIKIEHGLFSKVQESLELFRIDHFELRKPLDMRLLRQARLHIFTSDAELPNFSIYGVPKMEPLAENLRECQLQQRTLRGATTFIKA
ncbi:MAG: PH domain-containing protein [Edaphobacter sp.]